MKLCCFVILTITVMVTMATGITGMAITVMAGIAMEVVDMVTGAGTVMAAVAIVAAGTVADIIELAFVSCQGHKRFSVVANTTAIV